MNILITGATGFIGHNIVEKLLSGNHNIICTLREGEENPFKDSRVKGIVIYPDKIDNHVTFFQDKKIDGIIHLASLVLSGTPKSSEIENLIDSNVKFGTILLEIAYKSNIRWFVNTGTYWQNYNNKKYSPVNLYAATKQAFEDIAKYYYETNKIKFVTIRLFDTYGKDDKRKKIFNIWNDIARTGETLDMSPGEQIMDFSYIDDIVDAYFLLISYLDKNSPNVKNGDIFFLQSKERYSLKQLSKIFEQTASTTLNINWGGKRYKDREIMNPITTKKIIPEFEHKITIEDGIRRIVEGS